MKYTGTSTRASCHVYCIKHEDLSCYNYYVFYITATPYLPCNNYKPEGTVWLLLHGSITLTTGYKLSYSSFRFIITRSGKGRRDIKHIIIAWEMLAIYMATRPRPRACKHSVSCYIYYKYFFPQSWCECIWQFPVDCSTSCKSCWRGEWVWIQLLRLVTFTYNYDLCSPYHPTWLVINILWMVCLRDHPSSFLRSWKINA